MPPDIALQFKQQDSLGTSTVDPACYHGEFVVVRLPLPSMFAEVSVTLDVRDSALAGARSCSGTGPAPADHISPGVTGAGSMPPTCGEWQKYTIQTSTH